MAQHIASPQNPRLRQAARLRGRRGRERQRRMLIDGIREVDRAREAGVDIEQLFVLEGLARDHPTAAWIAQAARPLPLTWVAPRAFEKIGYGDRNEGMVAVAAQPETGLDQIALREQMIVGVLEGIEKPGNIGAIARTADAAGVSAVLLVDARTDLYNPNTIRASLGTVFTVPHVTVSRAVALDWLRQHGFAILATRVGDATAYHQADYAARTAVLVGSEAHGLSAHWDDPRVTTVTVPMYGQADSLNVSVTAALMFYEARRRLPPP